MPHSMIHPLTSFIFRAGRKIFPFKMMNDDFSHFYISVSSFFSLSHPLPSHPSPSFLFLLFFSSSIPPLSHSTSLTVTLPKMHYVFYFSLGEGIVVVYMYVVI